MNDLNCNVNSNIKENVNVLLKETISPILEKFVVAIGEIKNITSVLTRCTILSRENTPESRLAILKELENIGKEQNDLLIQVKGLINEEITKNNKLIEDRNNSLEQLKKENEQSEPPHL